MGYHRLMTHKAATAPKWVYYLLISGGFLAMQGAPLSWAGLHRYHHQVSDTEKDPHTPKRGFWYAYVGWMLGPNPDCDYLIPDLLEDKYLAWLGHGPLPSKPWLNFLSCVGFRVLLFFIFGPVCALSSTLAWLICFNLPNLINTVCHLYGYRTHDTPDNSRNNHWLALLTVGESYHNNHHRHPKGITTSENNSELDISGLFLKYVLRCK